MALNTHDQMREIKLLMSGIGGRLAADDVFTVRRTLDELVLAMNLLVGLVENHRHRYTHDPTAMDFDVEGRLVTGPMQAMEGK